MSDLDSIRNFVAIEPRIATAGQPTEEQLALLTAHGFAVVVNLGLPDPRYCLPDEASSVASLGMVYHHIPVNFQQPLVSNFQSFQCVMLESRRSKVFVHCAANYRVSCFMALFGEAHLGWSREHADAHVRKLWEPNEVWSEFLNQVRGQWGSGE